MTLTSPETPSTSRRRRWGTLLLRVLGLALLAYVVGQVDWRDSVVLLDGTVVRGEIEGEVPRAWNDASRVTLRTADDQWTEFRAKDLRTERIGGDEVPEVNEGLLRIVRRSDKGLLLLGFLLFGGISQFGVVRWWLLLRAQGIRIPYREAHRLTFLGFFFNNVVPGATGGDVVKAVYVSRRTEKRAEAVVTVLVDRVAGILALALIAAAVLAFRLDRPEYRELALFVGIFLGAVVLGASVFFSRRIRRWLRLENLSGRLPGGGVIKKADEAIFLWRWHKTALLVALALSFANQISIQGQMLVFARGLHVTTAAGAELPWTAYMVVLPVAFIVSALPALPGGWGVRETAFAVCFHFVGVDRNPAVALSVLSGATQLAWSLLGGAYFLQARTAGRTEPGPLATPASAPLDAGDGGAGGVREVGLGAQERA